MRKMSVEKMLQTFCGTQQMRNKNPEQTRDDFVHCVTELIWLTGSIGAG